MNNRNQHAQTKAPSMPAPKELADPKAGGEPDQVEVADGGAPAEPSVAASKAPLKNKRIKVVATREGYFQGRRLSEGEEFEIQDESQFGSWMVYSKAAKKAAKPKDDEDEE